MQVVKCSVFDTFQTVMAKVKHFPNKCKDTALFTPISTPPNFISTMPQVNKFYSSGSMEIRSCRTIITVSEFNRFGITGCKCNATPRPHPDPLFTASPRHIIR
jgi:hypothetical protein